MFPISMLSSLGALLAPSQLMFPARRRRHGERRTKRGMLPRSGVGRSGKRYLLKGVRP